MAAIRDHDVARFDAALFRHLRFITANALRAGFGSLIGGRLRNPPPERELWPALRRLARLSAAFALATDAALVTLGGAFKRREKLSGRLADAIAWMYIASAVIKRFHDEGMQAADRPFFLWTCDLAFWKVQQSLVGVCDNLPNRWAGRVLRLVIFPLGPRLRPPDDALGASVARAILDGGDGWVRLTRDIFTPELGEPGLGSMEEALAASIPARQAGRKVRDSIAAGALDPEPASTLFERASRQGVIARAEADRLRAAAEALDAAIAVDAYSADAYGQLRG
jgi:acyl-CoA dehydrogenase